MGLANWGGKKRVGSLPFPVAKVGDTAAWGTTAPEEEHLRRPALSDSCWEQPEQDRDPNWTQAFRAWTSTSSMPRARQACFYPSFRSRQGQALQQPHGDEVSTEQIKPTHRTISQTKIQQIRVLSFRLVFISKNLKKVPRLQDLPCPPPTFKALGSNHVRQQILTAGSASVTCPSNTFSGLHPCTTCAVRTE